MFGGYVEKVVTLSNESALFCEMVSFYGSIVLGSESFLIAIQNYFSSGITVNENCIADIKDMFMPRCLEKVL